MLPCRFCWRCWKSNRSPRKIQRKRDATRPNLNLRSGTRAAALPNCQFGNFVLVVLAVKKNAEHHHLRACPLLSHSHSSSPPRVVRNREAYCGWYHDGWMDCFEHRTVEEGAGAVCSKRRLLFQNEVQESRLADPSCFPSLPLIRSPLLDSTLFSIPLPSFSPSSFVPFASLISCWLTIRLETSLQLTSSSPHS